MFQVSCSKFQDKGFTLIELVMVTAIISVLASVVLVSMSSVRIKARDAARMHDMEQIQKALSVYYNNQGKYPDSDLQGCGGWDTPGDGDFISDLKTQKIVPYDFRDPILNYDCGNYRYYHYAAGSHGCDVSRGAFYVLGTVDMESSARPHPRSLGWSCSGKDWQDDFDWVTGAFEN